MKIQTMSIVIGNSACNASCPFCVAKRTACEESCPDVNWLNFHKAKKLALMSGVTTVLLTGKGEPTLYPIEITNYIRRLDDFPFIELQTNGILLAGDTMDEHLKLWHSIGLNTICLSLVHWKQNRNAEIYGGKHYNLKKLVDKLHKIGYTVRLNVIAIKNYIDNTKVVSDIITVTNLYKIKQLTIRPVTLYDEGSISDGNWKKITDWIKTIGTLVLRLQHGAEIYDIQGQNVSISNCLTIDANEENIRQLIFFSNGDLRYDWRYKGANLL